MIQRLIQLTETDRNNIRGIYKPNHKCEPERVEASLYVLLESIKDVPELAKKLDFTPLLRFNIGDKSASDLKYKAHIRRQEALINGTPK